MIDQREIKHHIQKRILSVLLHQKYARFRDLRPPKTDTNLFSYHLKTLLKEGMVEKTLNGYHLSQTGLGYVDRVSGEGLSLRTQPKIVTMLFVTDSSGRVLLQKRRKQPYIDTWTLPYGKVHIDDVSVEAAAEREASEKLGLIDQSVTHIGDCYIRVTASDQILSTTLAHICRLSNDSIVESETLRWMKLERLIELPLAPAVESIIANARSATEYFFEEFNEQWS